MTRHIAVDARIAGPLPRGGVFVDLGCGDGAALDELSRFYESAIGLDVSTARLKRGGRPERSWRFIEADLNRSFPLPSAYASAVMANQVLEHMTDPNHFIAEARRILRPGGVLVLTTPNIRYVKHIARLVVMGRGPSTSDGESIDGSWDDGHVHYFTHADLRNLLVRSGFRQVHSQALVDLGGGDRLGRRLLDRMAGVGIVREFMSGNALVISRK